MTNTKRTKIKICGITNLTDAQLATKLGADILGFNFYPRSARYISPQTANKIINQLTQNIITVPNNKKTTLPLLAGVFVNANADEITKTAQLNHITIAQLHGSETNTTCQQLKQQGLTVIKALRIKSPQDLQQLDQYNDADMFLLDAFNEKLYGGTGERFNWNWLQDMPPHKKIFLAGGITPHNITEALQQNCYGIDLCSGVEKSPGIKDHNKLHLLFNKIKTCSLS